MDGIATEGMAVSFGLILRHLIRHHLVRHQPTEQEARTAIRRFCVGSLNYPLVTAIGLLSAEIMLTCYALLTGFYILDQTPVLADDA